MFTTSFAAPDRFLPTPSARRATTPSVQLPGAQTMISTHALREEGDRCNSGCTRSGCHFYPRPPRGGRQP